MPADAPTPIGDLTAALELARTILDHDGAYRMTMADALGLARVLLALDERLREAQAERDAMDAAYREDFQHIYDLLPRSACRRAGHVGSTVTALSAAPIPAQDVPEPSPARARLFALVEALRRPHAEELHDASHCPALDGRRCVEECGATWQHQQIDEIKRAIEEALP